VGRARCAQTGEFEPFQWQFCPALTDLRPLLWLSLSLPGVSTTVTDDLHQAVQASNTAGSRDFLAEPHRLFPQQEDRPARGSVLPRPSNCSTHDAKRLAPMRASRPWHAGDDNCLAQPTKNAQQARHLGFPLLTLDFAALAESGPHLFHFYFYSCTPWLLSDFPSPFSLVITGQQDL
jgi:hypothetical protein